MDFNKKLYASEQKYKNSIGLCSSGELVRLKQEKEWLKEVNSQSLIASIGHLDKAFLDNRTYECPECGLTLDRDVNAAINIRNFALRNILKNTDGTSGINACGVGSSGLNDANCSSETIVKETRKSKHYKKCKEEA